MKYLSISIFVAIALIVTMFAVVMPWFAPLLLPIWILVAVYLVRFFRP